MGKIEFNIGQGGLGRPLAGKDYYSGLLFDMPTYPSGFSAPEPIKLVASLEDAENLGILPGVGETVATGGEITVTAVGAAGDVYTVEIKSTRNPALELASVIEAAAETPTTLGDRIAAAINAGTNVHGFTASAAIGVVSLVMAPDWGAAFNGAGLSMVSTGAGTNTLVQFTTGVGADLSALHYTVSEYFRMQPKGLLWIGIYDESGGLDGQDVQDIQVEAGGDIEVAIEQMRKSQATKPGDESGTAQKQGGPGVFAPEQAAYGLRLGAEHFFLECARCCSGFDLLARSGRSDVGRPHVNFGKLSEVVERAGRLDDARSDTVLLELLRESGGVLVIGRAPRSGEKIHLPRRHRA